MATFWPDTASRCIRPLAWKASRTSLSMPESSPRTMPDEQAALLPRGSAGERRLHVRAQPVADATDPAPPADDPPAVVAAQHDMHAATREPAALVEAGLGPARRDRPRTQLEHGALGRRPLGRQLEQHPLADAAGPEAACLGRDPQRRTACAAPDPSRRRARRPTAPSRPARKLRSSASLRIVPHQSPTNASATAASASLRVSRDPRAPANAVTATAACRDGGGRTQVETAIPAQADHTRSAGQPVSSTRRPRASRSIGNVVTSSGLTASPGRGAARCAPARCPARRPGRRPTGTARASFASRRSSGR